MSKKDLSELAYQIYLKVYGHIDDKYFQDQKQTEIYDWLANGDLDDNTSLSILINEWVEYEQENIAECLICGGIAIFSYVPSLSIQDIYKCLDCGHEFVS